MIPKRGRVHCLDNTCVLGGGAVGSDMAETNHEVLEAWSVASEHKTGGIHDAH
jgi:hypothetical protein